MAWQEVTFRCGCDGHVQVYGPTKDRARKAEWIAEKKDCDECYAARVEEERADAMAAAKAQAAEWELPDLQGSEKQIAWAERLRAAVLKNTEVAAATCAGDNEKAWLFAEGQAIYFRRAEARFWIDEMRLYEDSIGLHHLTSDFMLAAKKARKEGGKVGPTVVQPKGREPISAVTIQHKPGEVWLTTARKEDEGFIEKLKGIGFRWDGTWTLSVPSTPVGLDTVAAGIALEILDRGYSVVLPQPTVADLVKSGEFEREPKAA